MNAPTGMLRPSAPVTPIDRAAFAVSVLDGRVFVDVEIPRSTMRGRMRLLGRTEVRQVRQDTRTAMVRLGLGEAAKSHTPELYREWAEEFAVRTLAVAVRGVNGEPLASLDEWEVCDDDQIAVLWRRYNDLEAHLDPYGEASALTDTDHRAITEAAKKKDVGLLISYGSHALAIFAATLVAQPAS